MPHEIRLAGPWELSRADDVWERCALPCPTEASDSTAEVRLRRKFHRPSGLSDQSQLAIVVRMTGSSARSPDAEVNGVAVRATSDTDNTVLLDVTNQLREFNTIELTVPASTTVTEVKLRIVEPTEG